jgi:hypothetical protein
VRRRRPPDAVEAPPEKAVASPAGAVLDGASTSGEMGERRLVRDVSGTSVRSRGRRRSSTLASGTAGL